MAGVTEEQLQAMVDQQDELDSTVYRFETEAQDHERTFVLLWDRLREEENRGRYSVNFILKD